MTSSCSHRIRERSNLHLDRKRRQVTGIVLGRQYPTAKDVKGALSSSTIPINIGTDLHSYEPIIDHDFFC